jgi:hypothetical protein
MNENTFTCFDEFLTIFFAIETAQLSKCQSADVLNAMTYSLREESTQVQTIITVRSKKLKVLYDSQMIRYFVTYIYERGRIEC